MALGGEDADFDVSNWWTPAKLLEWHPWGGQAGDFTSFQSQDFFQTCWHSLNLGEHLCSNTVPSYMLWKNKKCYCKPFKTNLKIFSEILGRLNMGVGFFFFAYSGYYCARRFGHISVRVYVFMCVWSLAVRRWCQSDTLFLPLSSQHFSPKTDITTGTGQISLTVFPPTCLCAHFQCAHKENTLGWAVKVSVYVQHLLVCPSQTLQTLKETCSARIFVVSVFTVYFCVDRCFLCSYSGLSVWREIICGQIQTETDRLLSCQLDYNLLKLIHELISSSSFRRRRLNSGGDLHIGLIDMNEASVTAERYPSSQLTPGAGERIQPC